MANAKALDKRRKSVRNIRKITRTMELIATARFKKAMDRAVAATSYTQRITEVVTNLAKSGTEVQHPLLEDRQTTENATLIVLTGNRGLCGGYNGAVVRETINHHQKLAEQYDNVNLLISGKRGITNLSFRGLTADESYTHFDDQPKFDEVKPIADTLMEQFIAGKLDRLDVAYTRFISSSKQRAVVETLLPLGKVEGDDTAGGGTTDTDYEFMPSAESILEEVVPTSFRIKLFKCFLDAAVSEQIARMVAMKSATENADEMIANLSMTYNRARQSQITGEIMEIIGGVEALKT
ncbi:MAG: ATP synthase F1 subunit gamma [Planctomycetaceae bacterium]|jgi:F-type H+-transporting ATPase subunit gamma|nr:ATP synthase F1 subunit gamma [Planctomycetaceae bacterium]MBT4725237.1 ATP synthase F1 subunit gamma [Planctomycetaceae bacterium]MBT4846829.1 ATP synthase F1 subunit gamma [Planctomycetaceae bacterium]MBT5123012.1 ATP synthase F1 subunit gamma [Planctomycetaceae bacterium]MBT5599712.1 ATP synthase F1 subunit gamma [Planctomycetaceae bacterium]